jgi:hypothetical protein
MYALQSRVRYAHSGTPCTPKLAHVARLRSLGLEWGTCTPCSPESGTPKAVRPAPQTRRTLPGRSALEWMLVLSVCLVKREAADAVCSWTCPCAARC